MKFMNMDGGTVTDEILTLWREVGNRFHGHLTRHASELGLTPQQAKALNCLAKGPRAMGLLAEDLHTDASNITGMADRLEARGFIERRPHPDDRRVKQLALTPDGLVMMEELLQRLRQDPPMFGNLTTEEQVQLAALLRAMLEREEAPE